MRLLTRWWSATLLVAVLAATVAAGDDHVWWEGEAVTETNFRRDTWFNPQNDGERDALSAGAWLTNAGKRSGPELFARYRIRVPAAGDYRLWARKFWKHGPFRWRFDARPWRQCGRDIALADNTNLRPSICANWVALGRVSLTAGAHTFELRLNAKRGEAATACFDAFVVTRRPFHPRGKLRPGERSGRAAAGWWAFEPARDAFNASPIDLRRLNEATAGAAGFVRRDGDRLLRGDGTPVRFWGVNVGPGVVRLDRDSVDYLARRLAKAGFNLVRFHGPIFDRRAADPATVDRALLDRLHYLAAALKREGIYLKLSFYFPVWFTIRPGYGIPGYEKPGDRKPFSLLFFDPRLQSIYRAWARALFTTENPHTGLPLGKDPGVALVEILNEDSFFFWTFHPEKIPEPCRSRLEAAFARWLVKRHGSIAEAHAAWKQPRGLDSSARAADRVTLFDAWHMTRDGMRKTRKRARMHDQILFLAEQQREFYRATRDFFRGELGVRCPVSCSNWKTADPAGLDAIERWTYTAGDLIDQHGYFSGEHRGPRSGYSVSVGDTFRDRAAVREPWDLPLRFSRVAGFPQIISEVGWPNPNRFKAEFPFLAAAYGSLQDLNGICFFALHGAHWEATPHKFPFATPSILGQSPAAALAFRRGDIAIGDLLHRDAMVLDRGLPPIRSAAGPLPGSSLDDLRRRDLPAGLDSPRPGAVQGEQPDERLLFLAGRVEREFTTRKSDRHLRPGNAAEILGTRDGVVKSTTGQLRWNHLSGIVTLDAPRVQGAVGFLAAAGPIELGDITIRSNNEFASVMLIALDDAPLATTRRILIQAVTEERPFGWAAENGKITHLGGYPMNVRDLETTLTLRRSVAGARVVTLDANGYPRGEPEAINADGVIRLAKDALYAVVEFEEHAR